MKEVIRIRPLFINGEWMLKSSLKNEIPLTEWYDKLKDCLDGSGTALTCLVVNMFRKGGGASTYK